VDFHYW